MLEIIDDHHVKVLVSYEHRLVEVIWKGHCDSVKFRDTMTRVMRIVNAQGVTKWLCDMELLRYILASDQNWLVKELFHKLNPAEEIYRFAHVISMTNLELMSSLRIQQMTLEDPFLQGKLEVEVFMGRAQALVWLN